MKSVEEPIPMITSQPLNVPVMNQKCTCGMSVLHHLGGLALPAHSEYVGALLTAT